MSDKTNTNLVMNARSKLGHCLHNCCLYNAKQTYDLAVELLQKNPFDSNVSIVLAASFAFTTQYIPFNKREEVTSDALPHFKKHTISPDSSHMHNFIKFLQLGGAQVLPFKSEILKDLIQLTMNDTQIAKAVGLIINSNSEKLSPIFWDYFLSQGIDKKNLSIISLVISNCESLAPNTTNTELFGELGDFCNELYTNDETNFATVEESLVTLAFLIKHKLMTPLNLKPKFNEANLNSLVINCWAKYASHCNLEEIPDFSGCKNVQSTAFLKLIVSATQNPEFRFNKLSVTHWLWNECLVEFGITQPPLRNEVMHSPLSMSIEELNAATELTQYLPSWFFVQCMNMRSRSPDITIRILRILGDTPPCIAESHADELFNFFDSIMGMARIQDQLLTCIESVFLPACNLTNAFVDRVLSMVDVFDETNLTSRLPILSYLLEFAIETTRLTALFSQIWEALPLLTMSLSLLKVLMNFFIAVAPYLYPAQAAELGYVASAAIYAISVREMPEFLLSHWAAVRIYELCQRFYKIVSSDIVYNPRYRISDSYSVTGLALRLLQRIPPIDIENSEMLFANLPYLVFFCPVDAALVAISLFGFASGRDMVAEAEKVAVALQQELLIEEDPSFIMLAMEYGDLMSRKFGKEFESLYTSKVSDFNDDPTATRVILKRQPFMFPLLVNRASQFHILYEVSCPRIPTNFLLGVSARLKGSISSKDERIIRRLLQYAKTRQPPHRGEDSWIRREVAGFSYRKPELSMGVGASEALIAASLYVPVDPSKPEGVQREIFLKNVRRNSCYREVLELVAKESKDLEGEHLWLDILLSHLGVELGPAHTEKTAALRVVLQKESELPEDAPDWMRINWLRCIPTKVGVSAAEQFSSISLSTMFLKSRFLVSEHLLVDMINSSEAASMKLAILNYLMYYAQVSPTLELFENESSLLRDFFGGVDERHPLLFNAMLLTIASFVMMNREVPSTEKLASNFLAKTLKDASDSSARVYLLLPTIAGIYSKCKNHGSAKKYVKQFFTKFNLEFLSPPLREITEKFMKEI